MCEGAGWATMVPMATRLSLVLSCFAATLVGGCSGTSPSDTCIPGISVVCVCPNGQNGAQICTSAGAFAACVCAATAEDDGGAAEASEAGSDAQVAPAGSDAPVATLPPGNFAVTGPMTVARDDFTATLLGNGKVLLTGGLSVGLLASAELYDPAAGTFSATGDMATARTGHTATLLPNGQVLIVGGVGDDGNSLASAELYDPLAGIFTAAGDMTATRLNHTATLLANGMVLIAGGTSEADGGNTTTVLASAVLYDPLAGTFAATGDMTAERSSHTATLLGNRTVLMVGGDGDGASAELYDPGPGIFAATGNTIVARQNHTATLLGSGAVLIAGGSDGITALASAELYDPGAGTFAATDSMTLSRLGHTATLLGDGAVLIAGGSGVLGYLASAQLYR